MGSGCVAKTRLKSKDDETGTEQKKRSSPHSGSEDLRHKCYTCKKTIEYGERFFQAILNLGVFREYSAKNYKGTVLLTADTVVDHILCEECADNEKITYKEGEFDRFGHNAELLKTPNECTECGRPLSGIAGVAGDIEWSVQKKNGIHHTYQHTVTALCRKCTYVDEGIAKTLKWFNRMLEKDRGKNWIVQYMGRIPKHPDKTRPTPGSKNALEGLVLSKETVEGLELLVFHIRQAEMMRGLDANSDFRPSCPAFNFHGPPGTGKTLSASRIAKACGYELEVVTSGKLFDMYIGETEKKISFAFQDAKKENKILLFDEADSLLANRVGVESSGDSAHNSQVNTILKELDAHTLPVFFATNYPALYDSAFRRRVLFSVSFPLPTREQQVELFRVLTPSNMHNNSLNVWRITESGLSGGDIRNIVYNAVAISLKNGRKKPGIEDYAEAKRMWKSHQSATSRETPVSGRHYA
ncbi:MAG: ATP-binding protein [Candidatus Micrarchaeota archaeon]